MAWSGSSLVPYKLLFGTVLIFCQIHGAPVQYFPSQTSTAKEIGEILLSRQRCFGSYFTDLPAHPFSFYTIVAFFDRSGTKHVTCFCETLDEKTKKPSLQQKKNMCFIHALLYPSSTTAPNACLQQAIKFPLAFGAAAATGTKKPFASSPIRLHSSSTSHTHHGKDKWRCSYNAKKTTMEDV